MRRLGYQRMFLTFALANVLAGFHWESQPNLFLLLVIAYVMTRGLRARPFLPWALGLWQAGLTEQLFGYYSLCYTLVLFFILLYHERLSMVWLWQQCLLIAILTLAIGWGAKGGWSWSVLGAALFTAALWWFYDIGQRLFRLRRSVMSL
jgi:rod shape-determining protein MreD